MQSTFLENVCGYFFTWASPSNYPIKSFALVNNNNHPHFPKKSVALIVNFINNFYSRVAHHDHKVKRPNTIASEVLADSDEGLKNGDEVHEDGDEVLATNAEVLAPKAAELVPNAAEHADIGITNCLEDDPLGHGAGIEIGGNIDELFDPDKLIRKFSTTWFIYSNLVNYNKFTCIYFQ